MDLRLAQDGCIKGDRSSS